MQVFLTSFGVLHRVILAEKTLCQQGFPSARKSLFAEFRGAARITARRSFGMLDTKH